MRRATRPDRTRETLPAPAARRWREAFHRRRSRVPLTENEKSLLARALSQRTPSPH